MDETQKLKNIFFEEAFDLVNNIESCLLSLENNPNNKKLIDQIFRSAHTIKGSGSLFDFNNIIGLSHALEGLLEDIRSSKSKVRKEVINVIFKSVDLLKLLIESGKATKSDENADLNKLTKNLIASIKKVSRKTKLKNNRIKKSSKSGLVGELLVNDGIIDKDDLEEALNKQNSPVGKILISEGKLDDKQLEKALEQQKTLGIVPQTSIRVNSQKLDNLVDLIGELVISYSLIVQSWTSHNDDQQLSTDLSQMGKVINDLQDHIMSLRMIPINHTFNRMKRLNRDTSAKLGKEVELFISGEETEIDKNIVEDLNEILVHLVRNSIDHGIESPSERISSNKKTTGRIELNAYPKGGNIIIEIIDDGRGIPKQRIIDTAKKRGLFIDSEKESQIYQLMFEPGFSTADEVTSVSGRGVGMDVVKNKLDDIRGKIEVYSEEGKGTTFTIVLQPTLAIIDGMVFRVGSERMIAPTLSILESLRPTKEQVISIKGSGEAVMIRGKIYPLIRLHNVFSIETPNTAPWDALVMLAKSQGRCCGILIDELIGQQNVVIKSLGKRFQKIKAISGGAILGDGRVGLILDLDGLMDNVLERRSA